MDSRLIYSASQAAKYNVTWTKVTPDSEWIYFGDTNKIDKSLIIKTINEHFSDPVLLVALNRQESIEIDKSDIDKSIEKIIGIQDFCIWDLHFKKVIEFNRIGVMRRGEVSR